MVLGKGTFTPRTITMITILVSVFFNPSDIKACDESNERFNVGWILIGRQRFYCISAEQNCSEIDSINVFHLCLHRYGGVDSLLS